MKIQVMVDEFPLKNTFTISRGSRLKAEVITVKITKDGFEGWGECVPYSRYNETIDNVTNQIKTIKNLKSRKQLQNLLPCGSARNVLDCALWDLQAKTTGKKVFQLANLDKPLPVQTVFTLSLQEPEAMGKEAKINAHRPLLKLKLGDAKLDIERIKTVRKNAPESKIIVDANEGWSVEEYKILIPYFLDLGVKMIEQPFPVNIDDILVDIERPIPVCADESCHDRKNLNSCIGKYDFINIKLDKTGGLTEALLLKSEAILKGFKIMVGSMVGSSLSMAPAVLLAQGAKWVDLDSPLLLASDRKIPIKIDDKGIHPAPRDLWG